MDLSEISNQIESISALIKTEIKSIFNGKASNQSKSDNFDNFVDQTSSILVSKNDINNIILSKYKEQYDQISQIQSQVDRISKEINDKTKLFNQKIDEEKRKFNRNINNITNGYFEQKQMHYTNHENQMNDLEDQIYELKEAYDGRLTGDLERVVDEKRMLSKVYQSYQKEYDEIKMGIENSLKDICLSDESSSFRDDLDSLEIKLRDIYSEFSDDQLDEIEKLDEENKELQNQIDNLKAKYDPEIEELNKKKQAVISEIKAQVNSALQKNQQKYDSEFENIKLHYSNIEEDLINQLNSLKKERATINDTLKNELQQLKTHLASCDARSNKKIRIAKLTASSKIQEKDDEIQRQIDENNKQLDELKQSNRIEIDQLIQNANNNESKSQNGKVSEPIKVSEPKPLKSINSPRRSKNLNATLNSLPTHSNDLDINNNKEQSKRIMETIDRAEMESRQYTSNYYELKQKLENDINEDKSNVLSQISSVEKALKTAQLEFNELMKKYNEKKALINQSYTQDSPQESESLNSNFNKLKNELDRLRVEVTKRRLLSSLQAKHQQEMESIDNDMNAIEKETMYALQEKEEEMSEQLINERAKTKEVLHNASNKLISVLKELAIAKAAIEETSLSEKNQWKDIRNDISNSASIASYKAKASTRSTSSVATAPPILSPNNLPPLQK